MAKRNFATNCVFLVIIFLAVIFNPWSNRYLKYLPQVRQQALTNQANNQERPAPAPDSQALKEIVNNAVDNSDHFAVVIKNLKTGEFYDLNEHKAFQSGSLYKLWVMAAAFGQIQSGNLNEDEVLSEDVAS